MSIWEHIRPAAKTISARSIVLSNDRRSVIFEWADGSSTSVDTRRLRQYCPCAGCVEEWSGVRTFDIESIPQDMPVTEVQSVGNYALCFTFGDGHRTGIFQWAYLRDLCTTTRPASAL